MKASLVTVVNIRRSDRFILHLDLWKMSKLSFRARALDATKPLPVFRCEDLPDLHEYASINRAVPQMPTGMEKEEESVCFHLWKMWYCALVFILHDHRRPSFFLRKRSQNGRQFFEEKHDGYVVQMALLGRRGVIWANLGRGVWVLGEIGRFCRFICACGGYPSTKESCDSGSSDILSCLSGWGLVLA